jgi:hypothetical protein
LAYIRGRNPLRCVEAPLCDIVTQPEVSIISRRKGLTSHGTAPPPKIISFCRLKLREKLACNLNDLQKALHEPFCRAALWQSDVPDQFAITGSVFPIVSRSKCSNRADSRQSWQRHRCVLDGCCPVGIIKADVICLEKTKIRVLCYVVDAACAS